MENKNIYKGLECHCDKFKKIPINGINLGIAGDVVDYTITITEEFAVRGLEQHSKNMGIDIKKSKMLQATKIKITMNFGILSFIQAKIEGKDNFQSAVETGIGVIVGFATTSEIAISLLTRIATGAATGAAVGSTAPIVGTIIGAVAGALISGVINDKIFEKENQKRKDDIQHNEKIELDAKRYQNKINQIIDYLTRNHYIELRELNEAESEELCNEACNIHSAYFKTILLMLSFPNYLDRDKAFYETLQSQENTHKDSNKAESKEPTIKPIANALPLRLEIQECYDSNVGNPLTNTTIYIYNHRFKRVVAKGTTDSKGSLKIDKVSVGQETGIDKLSFIIDRDNLSERVA